MKKAQHLTRGIKHAGSSGCAAVLPRIEFGAIGKDNALHPPKTSIHQPLHNQF